MVSNANMNYTKNEETKLIIEGKEFELIKYACESDDKWYCGELGIVIEKKVWKKNNPANKKDGEITWNGASSGREEKQLEKLIHFGEEEIRYWKKKLEEKNSEKRKKQCEERLTKAEEGLKNLKELEKQVNNG